MSSPSYFGYHKHKMVVENEQVTGLDSVLIF